MNGIDSKAVLSMVSNQQQFVRSGNTKSIEFRIQQLQRLKAGIQQNEALITEALNKDLHKSPFEAYATEIGYVYDSLSHCIKNLRQWAKPKRVRTPLIHLGSRSYIYPEPYGSVLIVGPFNYPFMLVLDPLIGAISAGNAAIVKPSEYTPHVSAAITKLLRDLFEESYIAVVEGGKEVTSSLIHAPVDLIFFTGSTQVGKIVMKAAAENLVPVVLELGGKSPCIVDRTVDLDLAAQRIVWGKFLNNGQTCVAPDYLLVHKEIKQAFLTKMKEKVVAFYGTNPQLSVDYGRIVNESHWDRLSGLLNESKTVVGGTGDRNDLYLAPTIMDGVTWNDKIMEEEIFGPILPVLEYDDLDDVIGKINSRPKPLALYLFTDNKLTETQVIEQVTFGGGCINDTMLHLVSPYLPFGGVGSSGMGAYHGRHSFETFSHMKSVLKKSTRINLSLIFPPSTDKKLKLLKKFMK